MVGLCLVASGGVAQAQDGGSLEIRHALNDPGVQETALAIARRSLAGWLRDGRIPPLPSKLPPVLRRRLGVIVTLEKPGQVAPRGCRGTLVPSYRNLAEEIAHNAIAAALRDKRVKPLRVDELSSCKISLTVILATKPLQSLAQHDPVNSGLLARKGSSLGLVLPYEGRDSETQWKWAKRKAGLRDEDNASMLEVYAVRFKES